MSESKAMIVGSAGLRLSSEEKHFFRGERPWGFILFARNISEPGQIRDLVSEMRDCAGNPNAPVFIDQEGGRVQRLRPPLAPDYPTAAVIGSIFRSNAEEGLRAAWLMSRLHAIDLSRLSITSDCLPVLDVPVEGAHDVIGDRAYGSDPAIVSALGRAAAEGLLAGGILPVIKHIPGHGRAYSDSHLELPVVDAPIEELRGTDFVPFTALADMPMAMTAHVVYSAIDSVLPATTSPKVIRDIVRGEIGFDGLLMSDDVSMKALGGGFGERTTAIFSAGCDIVLHCNGSMEEMRAVSAETPVLAGKARKRADAALAIRENQTSDVEDELRAEFARLAGAVA